jgi:phosphonate transport system substrate-binding protein
MSYADDQSWQGALPMKTDSLRFTSLQAENADHIVSGITDYLAARLGISIEPILEIPWQQREALLDEGQIQVAWICGLPYVCRVRRADPQIELLAAPVMRGARYGDRPVYFSDVVVRQDSGFRTFADLRGATWAYNDPGSHSGYYVVRYHLALLGEEFGYFSRVIESGAHQVSLQMILDGHIDASAIDSTVLEEEYRRQPALRSRLRTLETLGPSPMPPWVLQKSLPRGLRRSLRDSLLGMHRDPAGEAILAKGHVARFAQVQDSDYDAIREMERLASSAKL